MAKPKTPKDTAPKLRFTVRHALADLYVILMFTFFPLWLSDQYASARRDKFWAFLIITCVAGLSVGIISVVDYFARDNAYSKKLSIYRDPFKLNFTDIAFFSFVGISLISTLVSGRIGHCFMGLSQSSSGRNMGLITILMLLVCYLVISRFFYFKKYVFYAIFLGITVVTLLAVLHYYYIDPFGHFRGYDAKTIENFSTTLGNKNYLSAFICVALPFSVGVAMTAKDRIMLIVANVSIAIQFMGLLVATSDGGFLGLAALLSVTAIVAARKPRLLSRFFLSVSVMAAGAVLLRLFDLIMGGKSKGYSSFSALFMSLPTSLALLIVFGALAVLFSFIAKKRNGEYFPKYVTYIVGGVIALGLLGLLALMVYFTFINTTQPLTGFMRFFRFNETWGTHRGFFWIKSLEIWWNDLNIWQKLFGTGPDTFYFAFEPYCSELLTKFNETSTNAAHNVYLNYLVTQGALGLLSYLALIGTSIYMSVKQLKNSPLALISLAVVVTYITQDIVNIANPINTPFFFIFIALGVSTLLKANSSAHLEAAEY